jgi:hypothetical protein
VFASVSHSSPPTPSKDCSMRKTWGSVSNLGLAEYVTHIRNLNKILIRKLKGRNHFEDLGITGMIILK